MGFPRAPLRAPSSVGVRAAVFAVGRRVYVAGSGNRLAPVTLTDDAGRMAVASLLDGCEVAILGWRPGWAGSARYRVRAMRTGIEGWLAVGNLRSTETAMSLTPGAPAPPATSPAPRRESGFADSEHRFGQRRT